MSSFINPHSVVEDQVVENGAAAFPVEHVEHSIQRIGDHAIWAIIGEFNQVEACKTLAYVCSAFAYLGRKQLAKDLWERMKAEIPGDIWAEVKKPDGVT